MGMAVGGSSAYADPQNAAVGAAHDAPPAGAGEAPFTLPKIRAQTDRIIAITVCTRPFRKQGPRIETERLGRKTLVHNYGHGGSGWSLSWGSSTLAVRHALATRVSEIAVIGCGALGLTSALLAQRAGLKVRIYAKERPPEVRSSLATGSWTPSSRFCTAEAATPELAQRWEEMARISYRTYQHMLGLPGDPIEWRDGYQLADKPVDPNYHRVYEGELAYADLDHRLHDLMPRRAQLAPGTHPFAAAYVSRYTNMIFNLSAYTHQLVADFLAAGGTIETREFASPGDIARLKEKTVINATGYGARALFGDESMIPVRGQLLKLIPQSEITYGLNCFDQVSVVPRRDGIIVQTQPPGDFNNADITVNREEAENSVRMLADVVARMRG
jgi:glycine/D-amino acid oxidase-like deaminating enzyme